MLDIAIIGAGPAGLSAGINAKVRNKNVKVFGNNYLNSNLYKAERIDNYLGFHKVSGEKILDKFYKHAKKMKLDIEIGKVQEIYNMGSYYTLNFNNNFIDTKSVIIATGISKSKLFKGEDEYLGKGVSYCATCDGNLYKGKTVLVYGEAEESDEEVHFLSELAHKVYYIRKRKEEYALTANNIELVHSNVQEILGDKIVERVLLKEREIHIDGVFILREVTPMTKLLSGLELENNLIKTNKNMETNLAGVFAAGDCTGKPLQIAKAVGEGLVAALSAASYVDNLEM